MSLRDMARRLRGLSVGLIPVLLSGCATVFDGGPDDIQINSTPTGARVTIYDDYGEVVAAGRTQFKVALKAGGNYRGRNYRVKIEKLGYEPKQFLLEAKANNWWWGNLLYGGPLGALVIDPVTGNMWKLDPAEVDIQLEKIKVPGLEPEPTPSTTLFILTPEELSPEQRARLLLLREIGG